MTSPPLPPAVPPAGYLNHGLAVKAATDLRLSWAARGLLAFRATVPTSKDVTYHHLLAVTCVDPALADLGEDVGIVELRRAMREVTAVGYPLLGPLTAGSSRTARGTR